MPTPEFILRLRERVGTMPLWLSGSTAVVVKEGDAGTEVLLVERADTREWSPVAGIIDPGEHPHAAAVREVAEEAGVEAVADRLVWVTTTETITYDNGDVSQYIDLVFRCSWISGDPYPADGEALRAEFFPVHALPPMTERNATRVRLALENRPEAYFGPVV